MSPKVPNLLTLSRLVVIPLFVLMFFYTDIIARALFLVLFIYASVTDFLDGYLARTYNIISNFGRIFDPIADKALILVVCIMVLVRDHNIASIILIPVLIILVRELVISGIREGLALQQIKVKVTTLSKYKTAFQMVALSFLIIGGTENIITILSQYLGILTLYIAMIISLISGISYIKSTYKDLTLY
ncbi:CDP-diacylglycerol--glycerol-3-phosphate 3-phosphatidyltransferase [Candidatus Hepatincolaceae symbiont of Richtersius coronifer]